MGNSLAFTGDRGCETYSASSFTFPTVINAAGDIKGFNWH